MGLESKLGWWALILALLLVGGTPFSSSAQPTPPLVTPSPTAGISSIIPALDEVENYTRSIRSSVEAEGSMGLLVPGELPQQVDLITKRIDQFVQGNGKTLEGVAELERDIRGIHSRLSLRKEEVSRVLQESTDLEQAIHQRVGQWKEVRDKGIKQGLSPTAVKRAQEVVDELSILEKKVRTKVEELLALRQSFQEPEHQIEKALRNLEKMRSTLRALLFVQDGPLLFSAEGNEPSSELKSFSFSSEVKDAFSYFKTNWGLLLLQLLIGAVGVFCVVKVWSKKSSGRFLALVEHHPIAFSSFLFLLTGVFLFQNAPPLVVGVLQVLLLPPIAVVALTLVGKESGVLILLTTLLFGVHILLDPFIRSERLLHLLQCGEVLLAAGICFLAAYRVSEGIHIEGASQRRLLLFSRVLLRILASACGGAAVFLVLGFWSLGSFLVEGLFSTLFYGILTLLGYKVLKEATLALLYSRAGQSFEFVKERGPQIYVTLSLLLFYSFLCAWILFAIQSFDLFDLAREMLWWFLGLGLTVADFKISLSGILAAVFLTVVGIKFSSFSRWVLKTDIYPRYGIDRGVQLAVDTAIHYGFLFLSLIIALGAFGVSFEKIALITGALSVGAGFGLQNVVNNAVSGIIVLAERPFRVGDLISVGTSTGVVQKVSMRSTVIRTGDFAEVIIPNAKIINEQLTNLTHTNTHGRINITIGVTYGSDLEQCLNLFSEAIQAMPEVLPDPAPCVYFRGFGQNSLDFQLMAWIPDVMQRLSIESRLLLLIAKKLKESGIEIPFPQLEVHLSKEKT